MVRKRRGNGEADETREMIVATAHKMFMKSGYRTVSTRQIADACGITQPALYHHFANKQELYVEVLRVILHDAQIAFEDIMMRYEDMKERLYEVILYIMLHQPENSAQMFRDISRELSESYKRYIEEHWKRGYLCPIAAIFEDGMKRGLLTGSRQIGVNAEEAAYLLLNVIGPFSHVSAESLAVPKVRAAVEKRASVLVDVLLYGLASDRNMQ